MKEEKTMKRHQVLTILFTLLTLTVNGLANGLPLNGVTTAEISDRFPIRFVPAGYVFSIWGVIYIALIAYTIYQALPAQAENESLKRIAPWYWLASLANSAWIFLWHYEVFTLTIVAMVTLLLSLIAIYRNLRAGNEPARSGFRWAVLIPFSLYLGWISVATIANAAQLLYFLNWSGWGLSDELWAGIMLVVATGLGAAMLVRERDIAYTLVLIWAFAGIAIAQADAPMVANSAWALSALLGLGVVRTALSSRRQQPV
jgi:benzodiazapine receptor